MHNEIIRTYAELQRQIHYALREQHPEWVDPGGDSPTCHSYEKRFAELLRLFSKSEHRSANTLNGYLSLAMSNNLSRPAVSASGFSLTRVMIHAFCLLRRPGKAAFFLAGMRREFSCLICPFPPRESLRLRTVSQPVLHAL